MEPDLSKSPGNGGEDEKHRLLCPGTHAEMSTDEARSQSQQSHCHAQPSEFLNILTFGLFEHEKQCDNFTTVLESTTSVNKVKDEYNFRTNDNEVICSIQIGNVYSGEGSSTNHKEAKKAAIQTAVTELRKEYYTIQIKTRMNNAEEGLSIDGQAESNKTKAIPDSKIGNKLKVMGWEGGGVGTDSQDIAEPVSLDAVVSRQELGLGSDTGITPEFKAKIKSILEDYDKCDDKKDLVFCPDLNSDERKIIHQAGQKMGLKTKSYGKNEERHLVVSKKVTWKKIFNILMQNGGEDEKYRLLPPGAHAEMSKDKE